MKYLLLTLVGFVLAWINVNASTCKIFKCGSIQQAQNSTRTCVEPHEGTNESHIVDSCQSNYTCTANNWSKVTQVKNATCEQNKEREFSNNTQVAGEFCMENVHCFNHDNGANCTKQGSLGYCITPLTNGSDCPNLSGGAPGHDYCPTGMYCASKKCAPALDVNGVCGVDKHCKTGLACIATDNSTFSNFTCQQFGQLADWTKFNIDALLHTDDQMLGINAVCQSYNYNDTDKSNIKECRPGDVSAEQNKNQLRRTGNDQMCNYTTYVGPKVNGTEGVQAQETAECGFNLDTDAWCRKRKGDRWFMDTYTDIRKIDLSQYDCHTTSTLEECYAAMQKVDSELIFEFSKRLLEIDPYYGFSRVANNDKCIAESITHSYWQGRDPDGASIFSILSFIGLASVSALFILL